MIGVPNRRFRPDRNIILIIQSQLTGSQQIQINIYAFGLILLRTVLRGTNRHYLILFHLKLLVSKIFILFIHVLWGVWSEIILLLIFLILVSLKSSEISFSSFLCDVTSISVLVGCSLVEILIPAAFRFD